MCLRMYSLHVQFIRLLFVYIVYSILCMEGHMVE